MRLVALPPPRLTILGVTFKLTHCLPLTLGTKYEQCSLYVLDVTTGDRPRSGTMIKAVFEEAAALTSVVLFVGMVAIWAQVFAAY